MPEESVGADRYEKKGYLVENFRVFRLKDSAMKPIPFHYHDFHKIIFFLNGSVDYVIEGKAYTLMPRDMVFVAAGDIHRPIFGDAAPYERIIIYISPVFLKKYRRDGDDLADCIKKSRETESVMRINERSTHDLLFHVDKLEKNSRRHDFANGLYTEILFVEFMILLNRAVMKKELVALPADCDPKIQELLRFINAHLADDLSVDKLAAKVFLSRYHLMRKFKQETGYSLHRYITSKRLLLARELLKTDIPATKVCYECGFSDYSAFSRAFRNMFKTTPKACRQNADKN